MDAEQEAENKFVRRLRVRRRTTNFVDLSPARCASPVARVTMGLSAPEAGFARSRPGPGGARGDRAVGSDRAGRGAAEASVVIDVDDGGFAIPGRGHRQLDRPGREGGGDLNGEKLRLVLDRLLPE